MKSNQPQSNNPQFNEGILNQMLNNSHSGNMNKGGAHYMSHVRNDASRMDLNIGYGLMGMVHGLKQNHQESGTHQSSDHHDRSRLSMEHNYEEINKVLYRELSRVLNSMPSKVNNSREFPNNNFSSGNIYSANYNGVNE